ncbi:penicillin-binding protein 1A [Rhizobacter sp. LjRoot28]|uniref:penicillin-binding protein 1A n=1 Tax=Rhizobacter sp. LjRoot28 TaxID=3342309 RepID=UPI003ECC56A6
MHADPADHPVPEQPRSTGWRRALRWSLVTVGVLFVLALAYGGYLVRTSPSVSALRDIQDARPSTVMSADGQVLGSFRRAKVERVALSEVSPHVVNALIATEDHRFREHRGIDVKRTFSAMFHTATGDLQGGSTITQQLARNLFPEDIGRSRSVHRKLKEMITALRIERVYSKDEILESYLNTVPFLYNVVGIEMAARTYCDTSARSLDIVQSATLVGMLKGTQYYNPVRNPERAQKRRNVVLAQMARHGHIAADQLERLAAKPLAVRLNHQSDADGLAPHYVAHVRKWLLEWAESQDVDLYADGLVIETTLDAELQKAANAAVREQAAALQQIADTEWGQAAMRSASARQKSAERPLEPFAHLWKKRPELLEAFVRDSDAYREAVAGGASAADAYKAVLSDADALSRLKRDRTRLEAGLLAIDPTNGEIKAWVGSRDFDADQYDHVAQAERQPGSTFKPFVYGAALEAGIGPERTYMDDPVEIPLGDGRVWKPTDMTGTSGAPMSLRDGLVYSKNTITAQVMQEVGVERTVELARALGVDRSKLDAVPSLALGTSPVTLLELVNAYASIARQGIRHTPVLVRRITDREGRVLATFGTESRQAMTTDAAIELTDMMRGVVSRGTGTLVRTRFGVTGDVAGKTGTTQNNTDGWFVLMHPQLVAGAWVGFNDARVTIRSNYWGQGGHNAVLLVGDFFRQALKARAIDGDARFPPSRRPPPPPEIAPGADGEWGEDGGGEPGGSWLDGWGSPPDTDPDRDDLPPGAGDSISGDQPKSSMELEPLLKLEGARALDASR